MSVMSSEADILTEAFTNAHMEGQVRLGAVQIEDSDKKTSSTLALGGSLGIKTAPISGVQVGATFYTTNALFGKDNESMFLDSNSDSYSIIGEAYIEANLGKTNLKAGRQILNTPYADSDDIGMVPNTFEGVTIVNQDIQDTTVVLARLNKWSGVDSKEPESFTDLQISGDALLTVGTIYEGIENTTLQAWHYKLDDANFNYVEAGYETEQFNLAVQYSDQDNSNRIYGAAAGVSFKDLTLSTAYNKVDGEVINGFGGGPFFSSSEDHTVAEVIDQEAFLLGAEYSINEITLALTHVDFEIGENETDYLLSYAANDKFSLDLIYSDMNDDGNMLRVFSNYNF